MRRRRAAAAAMVAVFAALWPAAATCASRYDPRLRFRTVSTPRFDIHFHPTEERLAQRLASLVENAAAEVDRAVGAAVGRVQVILVDQHDLSNGWATPLPYNTIEISAAPPAAESSIGNTEDWLRLVFVHEYTHIAHLSRAGGWINGLRKGFGRMPLLFPNLYQPLWAIEGIATWQESTVTHEGRVPAGDFRLLLDSAAAANRFDPLDRVNGGNVDWPGGSGAYLYGAYFHDYLSRKYGAASVRTLAAETGRRLPYLGSRAYKKVFGRSLGGLWNDFEAEARAASAAVTDAAAVRLTYHGFRVSTPRYGRNGGLFYSLATPHEFPALMELPRLESGPQAQGVRPRRVTTKYLGGGIALWRGRLIVDEIDLVRSVALQSDLWMIDPQRGGRTRLTREARAADPDVAPDGSVVVCTIQMADRRALALVPLGGSSGLQVPQPLISEPEVDFAAPRWSPDGREIAAERRVRGGPAEIVIVNVASKQVRMLASLPGGRSGSPVWMPDGSHVLFSSAVSSAPFLLHRVNIQTGVVSRLEGTGPSAESPEISPDGARVVFVGNTVEGYDLFSLPLNGARWTPVQVAPGSAGGSRADAASAVTAAAAPYSPWHTLAPTFWIPTLESDGDELVIGAALGTVDALGRHAYGIEGGWSARARPDWQIAYAYDRWRPTIFAAYGDDTDPWRDGELRTRELEAGLVLPLRRVRDTRTFLASMHASHDAYDCASCQEPAMTTVRRMSGRAGFSYSNAHEFGYSISAEEGGRVTGTAELSRSVVDQVSSSTIDGNGVALTLDVRRYWRAGGRHAVVAVRAALAGYHGDDAAEQVFSASGNGPVGGGFGFGVDAIGLLRGFDEDTVIGTRAAVLNVDYRFPLWRLGRGVGTIPVFARAVHGALFGDTADAWSGTLRWSDMRSSFGGELSVDTILGFGLPVTFTGGAAIRHDRATGRTSVAAFGRVGRAF